MYRQSEKNLLNSNTSSTCPNNMVNFGLLTSEIYWRVWGTPTNFNGFCVLEALLHGTLVVGVSQTAALNRGRHLRSAGRPSGWALAHILVRGVIQQCMYETKTRKPLKLECGPMPNLMVALPNTGGALCSTPQSLADAHY